MPLVVRQWINESSSQIDQQNIEFLVSKWVMIGMIKAELSKIANILEKTYIRQLEWTKIQATKRAQVKNSKISSIMQQRRFIWNGGLYFKSDKNTCISSNSETLNNVFCKDTYEKPLIRSIKMKATSKWPRIKNALENFSLLRNFCLVNVTHYNEIISKKSLYFFHLDRSPITMRPFLKNLLYFFTWVGHPL
jgi:hypothetical protein